MRLIRLIPILLFSFLFAAEPISSIPAVHRNLGTDEQGLYMRRDGRKIYARPANDKFEFTDMYGYPRGSAKGLDLDFRNRDLNGILYYGFINYKDGSHPLPVYFKRYSRIESGKAFINIADHLSGKYDMIGWQKRGYGSLGYRIINEKGDFIYDGKVSFEFKNNRFEAVPTLIEGPFADLITHESAVISFETTRPQRT